MRCKSNTVDPFLIYKGNHLVPFSKAYQNCLVHRHGIPQNVASKKGTHFTAKELREWAHDHETNWSYQLLHFPETASFLEHYNSLLITQQKFPSEGKSLQGSGAMLQDAVYVLNQKFYVPSNNTWYWEKVEVGVTQFTIFPIIYWGNWYFPPLQIWALQIWRSYDLTGLISWVTFYIIIIT